MSAPHPRGPRRPPCHSRRLSRRTLPRRLLPAPPALQDRFSTGPGQMGSTPPTPRANPPPQRKHPPPPAGRPSHAPRPGHDSEPARSKLSRPRRSSVPSHPIPCHQQLASASTATAPPKIQEKRRNEPNSRTPARRLAPPASHHSTVAK